MFLFGDSFDLYAQIADATSNGTFWDSSGTGGELAGSGRFTGSKSLTNSGSSGAALTKSSGNNDAVHHINVAVMQSASLVAGSLNYLWIGLYDGTSEQCAIGFRQDGAIVLATVGSGGTTLATYTGALLTTGVWYSFEIEIVIHNTAGTFTVRKNGNTANDYQATGLNTRNGSTNAYANKLVVGAGTTGAGGVQRIDDLLWRSDPTAVAWVGDVRCFTRMPAADVTSQWTRSSALVPVTPYSQAATLVIATNTPHYAPFTAPCAGTLGTAVLSLATGYTGNMKCTLFADSNGAPGAIIGSAGTLANPVSGNNTFTFASTPTLVQGTRYWLGFSSDTSSGSWNVANSTVGVAYANSGVTSSTTYANFPAATPTVTTGNTSVTPVITANITPTTASNAAMVAEPAQDGVGTYLSDNNVGDADLYSLQAIASTPGTIVMVTTRGLFQKSDAGTRSATVQLKSGTTTVQGASTALNTTFGWISRQDTTDPNTGAAWTATGVNSLQIGPKLTA